MLELTFMANEQFSDSQVAAASFTKGCTRASINSRRSTASRHFLSARSHERICRRAELDFGHAVPDGAPVIQRASESLMLDDEEVAPTIEWGEASRRVDAVDRGDLT